MTVTLFVENETDASCLVQWGIDFACADHEPLLILVPKPSKTKQDWESATRSEENSSILKTVFEVLAAEDAEKCVLKQNITDGLESSDLDRIVIDVKEVTGPEPASEFCDEIESGRLSASLLVLPAHTPSKNSGKDMAWHQRLFTNAECEAVIVRGNAPRHRKELRIMLATDNETEKNTNTSLRRGCQLAQMSENGSITLLFVRPDDDEVAMQIAEKHLDHLARKIPDKKIELHRRVRLAETLAGGIKTLDLNEYDLVLLGTSNRKKLSGLLREGDNLDQTATAVAAFRQAVPATQQIWERITTAVRGKVPQINRELRVSLVDRLQTSSAFDFDFVALISLSTLIAALGLVQDSGAVVIGAMLVAPLMTPLVAMGFSLVQGNEKLVKSATKSVIFGFSVALGIGAVTGLLLHIFAPNLAITSQMISRCSPNLLDLIVALASGVAGAYAMGRPNLVSAIPGVAIAAALVPPIATSGLALTMGNLLVSGGSLLLFVTNIIAIVLGTAVTFWAIGINSRVTKTESGEVRSSLQWPRIIFLALVLLSFVLAAVMSKYNPLGGKHLQHRQEIQREDTESDTEQAESESAVGIGDSGAAKGESEK